MILNEAHHAFGRAGFGSVVGSKNLKAIVVKASSRTLNLADPEAFESLRKELNPRIKEALASDVMRANGTAANLEGGGLQRRCAHQELHLEFLAGNGRIPYLQCPDRKIPDPRQRLRLLLNRLQAKRRCPGRPVCHSRWPPGPEYEIVVSLGLPP